MGKSLGRIFSSVGATILVAAHVVPCHAGQFAPSGTPTYNKASASITAHVTRASGGSLAPVVDEHWDNDTDSSTGALKTVTSTRSFTWQPANEFDTTAPGYHGYQQSYFDFEASVSASGHANGSADGEVYPGGFLFGANAGLNIPNDYDGDDGYDTYDLGTYPAPTQTIFTVQTTNGAKAHARASVSRHTQTGTISSDASASGSAETTDISIYAVP